MSLIAIDFEVFYADWLMVAINPIERTETVIVNDRDKFKQFFEEHKNDIFIFYNGRHYDQFIMKALLLDFNPKDVNDWIIVKDLPGWKYSDLFNKIKINFFDVMTTFHGLKTLEGFMGNNIKESSVDFTLNRKLTPSEIDETIIYCRHDVRQTLKVFIERKAEFDAQMALIKKFQLPLEYIGKTQAQLAAIILGAVRRQFDDEWNIRLPDTVQLGKYKYIGDWFLREENHDYSSDIKLKTNIAGVPHVIALGGIHGALDNYIYDCKDDEIFIMADVDQLYPTIMVEYELLSRAIIEPERFKNILSNSLELKRLCKKTEREPYKRICNITYGAEGDKFNAMYDPLHRNLVCVFGQLFMIDLIDKIEGFCKLCQSNTDGILVKVKKSDVPRLKEEIKKWEQRTRLHMSFDEFVKVIQRDVNNYIIVAADGSYKSKGAVVKKLNNLDYDRAIVNEAVVNYFIKGVPVEETIFGCDELKKFQQIVKVSSKYEYALHGNKKLNDKTLRVFASNDTKDGGVFKVKKGFNPAKFSDTSDNCFIINDDINGMKVPEKLNKQFYVELVKKRISQFLGDK